MKIITIVLLIGSVLTIIPVITDRVSFASTDINATNATTIVSNKDDLDLMESLDVNITFPSINTNIAEIGPGLRDSFENATGINATNANTNIADVGGIVVGDLGGLVIDPMEPLRPPPEVIHLRIIVHAVKVYDDHDGNWRGDGEWHLFGMVNGKPFKQVGQPDGEIDTPNDSMNDVRGEFRGNWGTAEQVNFNLLFVDVDVNNTNPLQELRFDFFGIEQDGSGGIPDIPQSIAGLSDSTKIADAVRDAIATLYSIQDKNYLGSFQKIFTKNDNWWVGTHIIRSDMIYSNIWFPEQSCEDPFSGYCAYVDWPDFSDWAMGIQVIDRDGPRCVDGWTYQYRTNICTQNQ